MQLILHLPPCTRIINNTVCANCLTVSVDLTYPGQANNITRIDHYIASFSCAFELYAYPFDIQMCSIQLQLLSTYDKYVRFAVEAASVHYSGPQDLSRYSIHNLRLGKNSGDFWLLSFCNSVRCNKKINTFSEALQRFTKDVQCSTNLLC